MNRKKFLKKGMLGVGSIIAIPSLFSSCDKEDPVNSGTSSKTCVESPTETAGPFPIKTPADWVRENIIGDRTGIPLMITFTIQNTNNNCKPTEGLTVDLWHCDAQGNYSEYSGQVDGDFTSNHFLRGRQTTDFNGNASFMSIYPGWYPGRAPHLHVEVLDADGNSLLTTQIAFPEEVSSTVFATADYKEGFPSNAGDNLFSGSLEQNLADSVIGNTSSGYVMTKIIKVSA